MVVVILDPRRERLEVHERELARGGAEERVLLVNRLECREVDRRSADRCDHDRKPSAGSDVDHALEIGEVRDQMEAVEDVIIDVGWRAHSAVGAGRR